MLIKRDQGLANQERTATWKLLRAFEEAKNRHTIGFGDRQLVRASNAGELNAANPYARTLWGNSLWSEFNSYFDLTESRLIPETPLFWVTLVDTDCMTELEVRDPDVTAFAHRLRKGLRGLSYLGMMDSGLYANIQPGTNYSFRTGMNWHLHIFAWGENREQIKDRAKLMNACIDNYRPIVLRESGGEGFNWSQVTEDNFARRFRYMCKSPRKAYRIGPTFIQSKSELRHGQRITLFHLLKNLSLDELTVAGGDGVEIRRRALRHVTRPSEVHRC